MHVNNMDKARNFKTGPNTVRSTKDHVDSKVVGLTGSLFYGWDRTSWPIPFVQIAENKEAFDRRHTVKVCNKISLIKNEYSILGKFGEEQKNKLIVAINTQEDIAEMKDETTQQRLKQQKQLKMLDLMSKK